MDLMDKAKELAEKAKDVGGDVWDKTRTSAGDVWDKTKDVAGDVKEKASHWSTRARTKVPDDVEDKVEQAIPGDSDKDGN